jgi:hypothetical protein
VQILLCRHFYKVKISGRFWPNAQVHLAEWRPENLATLPLFKPDRQIWLISELSDLNILIWLSQYFLAYFWRI